MPTIKHGTRRLYDALGTTPADITPIISPILFQDGKSICLYIGPNPTLGVLSIEGSQYHIPGKNTTILKSNADYKSECYLEIILHEEHEITEKELELLKSGNSELQQIFLKSSIEQSRSIDNTLDAISGIIGLRIHKQLVLKLIAQNTFLSGDFDTVSSFSGPATEILSEININEKTHHFAFQLISGIKDASPKNIKRAGTILHWLLRAWNEENIISKFMYLFIPIEAMLPSSSDTIIASTNELQAIAKIVESSDSDDKKNLLDFLEKTKSRFNPSLISRFEDYARKTGIAGWEMDVHAFKKYNRMRNLLLHSGNRQLTTHLNIEENMISLEDLVERYIAFDLMGSDEVYPCRWRTFKDESKKIHRH